jgi:hypothetical protein
MSNEPRFEDLYPDIVECGGLHAALRAAMAYEGPSPTASGPVWARVEKGPRFCQVCTAALERLFLCDFWNRGVVLATADSPHLLDVAAWTYAWVEERLSTPVLARRFPPVAVEPIAEAFEAGTEVEWKWKLLGQSMMVERLGLAPLLSEAMKAGALRQLFPFTSHEMLCFSRCTGYPYSGGCPSATPNRDGSYTVRDGEGRVVGTGGAREVVDMLVGALPTGCGPAVQGTADSLRGGPP